MDKPLNIMEEELKLQLFHGWKKKLPHQPLKKPPLKKLKLLLLKTKSFAFSLELMLPLNNSKLLNKSPNLLMMLFLPILGPLMLLPIMELDPNLLFFSENSMLLESLSLEKSLLLTLKNSLKITKPPLLWDLTKNLLEKSLEKITQLYLSLPLSNYNFKKIRENSF